MVSEVTKSTVNENDNADVEDDETNRQNNLRKNNNASNSEKRDTFSNDLSTGRGITVDNSGSDDEDGLESHSDEQSEGDSDTTADADGSDGDRVGDVDGYVDDSDGSSCVSGETCLDWCKWPTLNLKFFLRFGVCENW